MRRLVILTSLQEELPPLMYYPNLLLEGHLKTMSDQANATGPERFAATVVRKPRELTPAAKRALSEAEERRNAQKVEKVLAEELRKERSGRDGPEPTRYGDWEKNGIISDF